MDWQYICRYTGYMSEGTQRRLAAIVSADVVGYSRLMGADEAGTHTRLQARFADLVLPLINRHRGRLVKLMGDGLLAEFPSVVDAVDWAVKVQSEVAQLNEAEDDTAKIEYRVGVNLGDVIVDGDDIFGDGVNVAARLQETAKAGGIAISDIVQGQIRDRLDAVFSDGGSVAMKNIAQPVHIWRWPAETTQAITDPADEGGTALPLPDKPSIAVLPFDNMSGDVEQEFFADGISEDIITDLSRIRWLFVIARNSSFVFKGKAIDVRQIARELGVRYLLEGSVRKAANRVRITAQLIDAETSNHLWAERYDRDLDDIFAVQDEITEKVAGAIEPAILAAEGLRARNRSSDDLNAWEALMRAVSAFWRLTEKDTLEAINLLESTTESYPEYAPAYSMLAFALLFSAQAGWRDFASVRDGAAKLAKRAVDLDDQDAWAHVVLGYMHTMNRETAAAIKQFTDAIELNPNFASAYGWRGFAKAHAGLSRESIEDANIALRLSPKDPQNSVFHASISLAHFLAGRYEDCIEEAQEIVRQRPGFPSAQRMLCVALARSGKIEEARAHLDTLMKLQPNISASQLRRTLPYPSPEHLEQFVGGLVIAGLPDE